MYIARHRNLRASTERWKRSYLCEAQGRSSNPYLGISDFGARGKFKWEGGKLLPDSHSESFQSSSSLWPQWHYFHLSVIFFSSLPSWDSHGRFKLSVLPSHLYTSTSHYIGNTKLYCRNSTVQLLPNSYLIKDKRLSTWSMMKMLKISDECSDIEGSWISLPLLKAQETSRRGRQKDPKSQRVEKMGGVPESAVLWTWHGCSMHKFTAGVAVYKRSSRSKFQRG